jgi:metal-responsive CopG/Arc/MetJ family transcriptional regulator
MERAFPLKKRIHITLDVSMLNQLDVWWRRRMDIKGRSDAIRYMIERVLLEDESIV